VNRVKLAVAACAMLLLGTLLSACAVGGYAGAAQEIQPLSASSSPGPTSSSPATRMLADGLTITVSPPREFTPTSAASPQSPRAVAFDLVVRNDGTDAYHPAELAVTAIANRSAALQVIDSTQGYTGFAGATRDVAPGETIHLSVAFAVPAQRSEFRLMVQPDSQNSVVTLFEGAV
jgi:hypothetical protein